ncbi:MAG: TlpA family protein disulfide reductase [Bdellovibrionales bacterium]
MTAANRKKWVWPVAGFVVVAALGASAAWHFFGSKAQRSSPIEILRAARTLTDQSVGLSDPAPLTIVNFWATWCGPCIQETPSLFKLVTSRPDLRLISVSEDSSLKDLKKFLSLYPNSHHERIKLVYDEDRSLSLAYGVTTFPTSFILDRNLKIIHKVNGAIDWQGSEAAEWLKTTNF